MGRGVLLVAVIAVSLLGLVWAFQRHLIYLPSTARVASAESSIPGARDAVLHTSDGLRLGAWLVPAEQPDRGFVVLVANGNAGDRTVRAPLARTLAKRGVSVLLFDYRGYAGNPGSPSEAGLARDVRAARHYLVEEAGFPPDRLLYFGESLGTAVVTELAAEHPPAGLVLRSPFVDLASVGRIHYPFLPVRTLLRDRFPLAEHLVQVKAPVVVVYGGADSIVPPSQSRTVAESAPNLLRLVKVAGAGHNDPALLNGKLLIDAIVNLTRHR